MAPFCCASAPVEAPKPFPLIGEEAVPSDYNAFTDRLFAEAEALLRPVEEDGGWAPVSTSKVPDLHVYARPVTGSKLVVARAIKTVPVPPGDLFRFMVSVDGYKIIDPDTKNHEEPPIERLPWRDRAEVVHAKAEVPLPFCTPRDFVVLNLIDHGAQLFISKSILRDDIPKGAEGRIRAINTFLLQMRPAAAPGSATLDMVLWFDMAGKFPVDLTNSVVKKVYFQELWKRLLKYLAEHDIAAGADKAAVLDIDGKPNEVLVAA